jgi:uncharacterized coiled-coil protein SlyX
VYTESVLLESRSLRTDLGHKVEVLDKVKALALSADGIHATTRDVAEYFEVGESVVNNLLGRHREELEANGLRVLHGSDLREFVNLKLSVTKANANSYPQMQRRLAVYTRRTILNVAMLLRDSEIAQRVRAYLLDVEERPRTAPASGPGPEHAALDRRVTNAESAVSHIGSVLQELGPVIGRMSVRLERVDNRLAEMERRQVSTERVVGAMSQRLADMGEDMRTMRGDINRLARTRQPRRGR